MFEVKEKDGTVLLKIITTAKRRGLNGIAKLAEEVLRKGEGK
jgi:hypothetical protein